MDLIIDFSQKRAITSLSSDSQFLIPSLILGEAIPFRIAMVKRTYGNPDRYWEPVSLSGYTCRLGLGETFQLPIAGSFMLTFGGDNTGQIPFNVSAANLEVDLNAISSVIAAGGVTVTETGTDGYYIVQFTDVGARDEFEGDATNLAPLSIIEVDTLLAGSGDVAAVQTIRLLQNCAALVTLGTETDPAEATATVVTVGGGGANCKFRVELANDPYDGSWTVTIGGVESPLLAWNVSAADLQTALESMSNVGAGNILVVKESETSWLIGFQAAKADTDMGAITADGDPLRSLIFRTGTLQTGTAAMALLFGEADSLAVIAEVEVTPPAGLPQKIFRQDLNVLAPVIFDEFIDSFGLSPWKVFTVDIPDGAETMTVEFATPFAGTPNTVIPTVGVAAGHDPFMVTLLQDTISASDFTVAFGAPAQTGDKLHVLAYA